MINFLEKLDLKNYTLIIPSVCVGNVAQLATDLLISSLKMKKIGTLWDPSIIPLIGPSAYAHETGITTASDLYICKKHRIVILQLRSPLIKGLMGALFDKLTEFIKNEKIEKLILLSAAHGYEKHSIEMNPIGYCSNEYFNQDDFEQIKKLQWNKNDERILGGGFANDLFNKATLKKIPTIILYKYVYEGNNCPDAYHILSTLNEWINAVPKKESGELDFISPSSWKYLFGNNAPQSIY